VLTRDFSTTRDHAAAFYGSWAHGRNAGSTSVQALMLTAGSVLLGIANGSSHPALAALLFLALGVAVLQLFVRCRYHELQAFLWSYSVCVLAAGLAQYHERSIIGDPIGETDAVTFYHLILEQPLAVTLDELRPYVDAVLPVFVWQRVYHACTVMGLDFGPYLGVLFNAAVVGLAGSLTVLTARELFGDDDWRLRRTSLLYASCGLFALFGAVLLRDGFALLLNTLVLWAFVRALRRLEGASAVIAVGIAILSWVGLWYIREESALMLGPLGAIAFIVWYWRARLTLAHVLVTLALPALLVLGTPYIKATAETTLGTSHHGREAYLDLARDEAATDSLGLALVNRQPLPIRLALGTGRMLVFPIPLWAYLQPGASEYQLLKTWQGLYMVGIVPLVAVGLLKVARRMLPRRIAPRPAFYVAAYALVTLMAVIATSMETRHHGQFLPAFVLLAAMPDTRDRDDRRLVRQARFFWLAMVALVHVAWGLMKSS